MAGVKQAAKMQLPSGLFLAPMVRGSELGFRMLARRSGNASLCFSPMLRDHDVISIAANPSKFVKKELHIDGAGRADSVEETAYLLLHDVHPADTANLVVQLCGSRPSTLAQATTAILDIYSNGGTLPLGLDFNLGCPQECASKSGFGAFLVERNAHSAIECVASMRSAIDSYISESNILHSPMLSAKIRLLGSGVEDTIDFVKRLRSAGADYVTVHCRDRSDKHNGSPDWDSGGKIVDAMSSYNFPIVLNGGISNFNDYQRVSGQTKCHAVMAATGYLRNHRGFEPTYSDVDVTTVAVEYLDFVDIYPPPSYLYIQKHLRWIFRDTLQPEDEQSFDPGDYSDWRVKLWTFLVRPYLRTNEQYRMFVALYVKLSGSRTHDEAPESIRHLIGDVTFGMVKKAGLPVR